MDGSYQRLAGGEIPNESWAFTAWCEHIERTYPDQDILVGIEEGGGMSSPFDQVMQELGWSVRQLSPEAVRTYRETVLRIHNKTDDTDALTMARMLASGAVPSLELNQERAALRRATRWRRSLVEHKTALIGPGPDC
jgi:transposase